MSKLLVNELNYYEIVAEYTVVSYITSGVRTRNLLLLMANISETLFNIFTMTIFFKCVISLKLHLHVKLKKKFFFLFSNKKFTT